MFLEQQIGSCDTEDWSNDLVTGIKCILLYIQIENIDFEFL